MASLRRRRGSILADIPPLSTYAEFRILKNNLYENLYGFHSIFDVLNARLTASLARQAQDRLLQVCTPPRAIEDAAALFQGFVTSPIFSVESKAVVPLSDLNKPVEGARWFFDLVWLFEELHQEADASKALQEVAAEYWELLVAFLDNCSRDAAAFLKKQFPKAMEPNFTILLQLGCSYEAISREWDRFNGDVAKIAGCVLDVTKRYRSS